jgi:hypothetical protein
MADMSGMLHQLPTCTKKITDFIFPVARPCTSHTPDTTVSCTTPDANTAPTSTGHTSAESRLQSPSGAQVADPRPSTNPDTQSPHRGPARLGTQLSTALHGAAEVPEQQYPGGHSAMVTTLFKFAVPAAPQYPGVARTVPLVQAPPLGQGQAGDVGDRGAVAGTGIQGVEPRPAGTALELQRGHYHLESESPAQP